MTTIPTYREWEVTQRYPGIPIDCYNAAREAGLKAIAELTARAEKAEAERDDYAERWHLLAVAPPSITERKLANAERDAGYWHWQQGGMTKRELIAMHIMAGLDGKPFDTIKEMAECAIGRADTLLNELG